MQHGKQIVSFWNLIDASDIIEPHHNHCGMLHLPFGSDTAHPAPPAGIPCRLGERADVAIILRTIFIAALGTLILFPLSATNGSVDTLLAGTRVPAGDARPAWRAGLEASSEHVMARLYGLKAEIRADMCRRGEQQYCLGGICLPVPQYDCAKK